MLGEALLRRLDDLAEALVEAILREDPSYSGPGGAPREDLQRSCHDKLERILQSLSGRVDGTADPFDAPRATGRRRAEQGVPVESVLHAYRVGFRIIWEGLVAEARGRGGENVEALVDAATEVWELVDVFSTTVGDSYRVTEAELARRGDRRREALIDALLEGRGTERSVAADAAAALDLPEHGRYAVAVVAGEQLTRAAIVDALRAGGLREAGRTRTDREILLVSLGAAGPSDLAQALEQAGGVRAGV